MRQERFVNNARTQLSGSIDDTTTSVGVSDGSVFPSEGDFRVVVGGEIMLVTARSGNTLTVERGAESTSAAAHTINDEIKAILTKGSLEQYKQDFPSLMIMDTTPPCRMFSNAGAMIGQSDFSWDNQGSSTSTDQDNGLVLFIPGGSRQMRVKYRAVPATPYSAIMAFYLGSISDDPQLGGGMVIGDGTKYEAFTYYPYDNKMAWVTWANTTGPPAAGPDSGQIHTPGLLWQKIYDDGVDLTFSFSPDGANWQVLHSRSRTTYLSSVARVGFMMDNGGDTDSHGATMVVKHWSEE